MSTNENVSSLIIKTLSCATMILVKLMSNQPRVSRLSNLRPEKIRHKIANPLALDYLCYIIISWTNKQPNIKIFTFRY